jgi:uncharacterized protein (TIGR03067 family)
MDGDPWRRRRFDGDGEGARDNLILISEFILVVKWRPGEFGEKIDRGGAMRAIGRAVLLLAGLGGPLAWGQGAPTARPGAAADAEADLAALQGTWGLVYAETDGTPAPAGRIRSIRVAIRDRASTVYFGDEAAVTDVRFALDATKSPRQVTDTLGAGPDAGREIKGIYRLDGDTLFSCVAAMGQNRPTAFETAPGRGHTLRVFRRMKPDEGEAAKRVREELTRFGGTWAYESMEVDGRAIPAGDLGGAKLAVRGDEFVMTDPMASYRGKYAIDPAATPRTIDITFLEGPEAGKQALGIYELEGDTYRVCVGLAGKPRPTAFATGPGSGHVLQVLKRRTP